MIEAKGLSKAYRRKLAVDDISFKVETGKVTGFLGPNGAGKSTTMRLMLGLDAGTGTTTYDGKLLSEYERPSSVVGILLEAKAFHPTRSAWNHLYILALEGGIDPHRVDEVLETVGLTDVAGKGPGKFSLGMAQRLGIAAAILGKPKYLLLDEPANGLDPEGIAWLRQFIRDYADAGNAVFISSHLLAEIAQMADNVVVIGKGKLIASSPMEKLLARTGRASVFVRTTGTAKLKKLLKAKKVDFDMVGGGFRITGQTTDKVGKLAAEADVTILELSRHEASLEEAFLELTAGSNEFSAGKKAAR